MPPDKTLHLPRAIPALETNEAIVEYYAECFRDPQFFRLECTLNFVHVADARD